MNEDTRKKTNAARLLLIHTSIRTAVADVIGELEHQDLRPLIHSDVYRTPKRQLELYNTGMSKLRWGYHNATNPDGTAGSLAADIIDAELNWNIGREFWYRLGASALRNGLGWGGLFGLGLSQKNALRAALDARNYTTRLAYGWDPAHVETMRVTVLEAKRGQR